MIYPEYCQDVLFEYYDQRISALLSKGQKEAAQNEAFKWLQEYENRLCISVPWNWKIAKKQIASFYFGKPPSVQLHYQDNIEIGIEFIRQNANKNLRCSYHKFDTACHSTSWKINPKSIEWIKEIKSGMSEKDIIDIFAECSTSTSTCFRRMSLQYNEEIAYEMGYGQAMYVFETERGQHDVSSLTMNNGLQKWNRSIDDDLTRYLEVLIENHESHFAMKTHNICYYLGVPQISIEGYFETTHSSEKPVIVDIDLPFDRAFF